MEPSQLHLDPVKVTDVDILGLGIHSKEQMEVFVWFQDSQNTRRSGVKWGLDLTDLAKDQIVDIVGYQLIPFHQPLGPTAVITIVIMFIECMVRMLLDIMGRTIFVACVLVCGLWMFGALWDTAFQVAVSPIRWAEKKGREGAGRIKNQMKARVAYAGVAREAGTSKRPTTWKYWQTGRPRGVARCMDWDSLMEAANGSGQEETLEDVGDAEEWSGLLH